MPCAPDSTSWRNPSGTLRTTTSCGFMPGTLSRADLRQLHHLEGAERNGLELIQVAVVPAGVGGPRDCGEGSFRLVDEEHPVALQGDEDDARHSRRAREIVRAAEPDPR